jgi:hypothetical protein
VFTTSGCISTGYIKVPEGQKNYILKGFSLSPPLGGEWYVQLFGESSISFTKKLKQPSPHTYAAVIWPQDFDQICYVKNRDDFFECIKKNFEIEQKQSTRFEFTKSDCIQDKRFGEFSVKCHSIAKDYKPAKLPSEVNYLIMDNYDYFIKHPTLNKYFRITYSERSIPAEENKSIKEDAQHFFDSIQLITQEN